MLKPKLEPRLRIEMQRALHGVDWAPLIPEYARAAGAAAFVGRVPDSEWAPVVS